MSFCFTLITDCNKGFSFYNFTSGIIKLHMEYNTQLSKIYFLKMSKPPHFKVASLNNTSIQKLTSPISSQQYLALYKSVGEHLNWLDRIFMDETDLYPKINANNTHIYLFYIDKKEAGYCEFVEEDNYIEILYFGLKPAFVGQGYGKYFLQQTILKAWQFDKEWIQLNTCDLDHPNALPNYLKMGFTHYKTVEEIKKVKAPNHK